MTSTMTVPFGSDSVPFTTVASVSVPFTETGSPGLKAATETDANESNEDDDSDRSRESAVGDVAGDDSGLRIGAASAAAASGGAEPSTFLDGSVELPKDMSILVQR